MAAHARARAALARAADLLSLRLAHLHSCVAARTDAGVALERAIADRDAAQQAARDAARAYEIARARHDQLDTRARAQRRQRARAIEERATEIEPVARRVRP